jgi:hypothetical protein
MFAVLSFDYVHGLGRLRVAVTIARRSLLPPLLGRGVKYSPVNPVECSLVNNCENFIQTGRRIRCA